MAFPLGAIATGLSVVGSLQGILGGNAAKRRAQEAYERALRDMQLAGDEEFNAARGAGATEIAKLTGGLNDALASTGRSLGSSLAGAGVYNSSATAGALQNQAAENSRTIGSAAERLQSQLQRLRAQNNQNVANARLGYAGNMYNDARSSLGDTANGIASFIGSLGQFNQTAAGVRSPNQRGLAANGNRNSVLDQVPKPMQGPFNIGGYGQSLGQFSF